MIEYTTEYDGLPDFEIIESVSGFTLGMTNYLQVARVQFEDSFQDFILAQRSLDFTWEYASSNVEAEYKAWERDQKQGFTQVGSSYQYMMGDVKVLIEKMTDIDRFMVIRVMEKTRGPEYKWSMKWTNRHVFFNMPRPIDWSHQTSGRFGYATDMNALKTFMHSLAMSVNLGVL